MQSMPPQQPTSRDLALQCLSALHNVQACVLQLVQQDITSQALIKQLKAENEALRARLEECEKKTTSTNKK